MPGLTMNDALKEAVGAVSKKDNLVKQQEMLLTQLREGNMSGSMTLEQKTNIQNQLTDILTQMNLITPEMMKRGLNAQLVLNRNQRSQDMYKNQLKLPGVPFERLDQKRLGIEPVNPWKDLFASDLATQKRLKSY